MMVYHKWKPIQPIEQESEQYDFAEIKSLQQQWLTIRKEYESSTPQRYQAFMERLGRSWAIETGIIEGLYTLDRGVTETLVERGIVAEYIDRSATNKEPDDLVSILNDHQEAIDFVHRYIRDGNSLTRSFIRQLHQIFTRHQDTYRAVDQFGNAVYPKLDKGAFKKEPNNPTRPDGGVHEYCPPVHVESELDNLVYFYNECQKEKSVYHPLLTGAWLHHRFTQIHPFQDGNGRVARALLTWHLVREGYLPIVISRDDRERYIETLELADSGDLNHFIDLIVQLEKRIILQALGEPEPVGQVRVVDQVVDHIVEQIRQRNQNRANRLRSVNDVAEYLRDEIGNQLHMRGQVTSRRLSEAGMPVQSSVDSGGPENRREHWYSREINQTAHNAKHWAASNEARYFVRLLLVPSLETNTESALQPVLRFVVSLHHVGRELSGVMAATAFARVESPHSAPYEDEEDLLSPIIRFEDCTINPFTFTWESDGAAIIPSFVRWTEENLSVALSCWNQFLM